MAVLERKARIGLADLVPEAPHAKVVSPDLGIVKQHNAPLRQFGQPDLEVVADGSVGVQTIDVQKVNAASAKSASALSKVFRSNVENVA